MGWQQADSPVLLQQRRDEALKATPHLSFEISGVFTARREEIRDLQSPAIRAVPPQEGASLVDLLFPPISLWWEGIEITANGLL